MAGNSLESTTTFRTNLKKGQLASQELILQINAAGITENISGSLEINQGRKISGYIGYKITDIPLGWRNSQISAFEEALHQIFLNKKPQTFQIGEESAVGSTRMFGKIFLTEEETENKVVWVIIRFTDETESRIEQLEASQKHWKSLIDHSPDWIIRYDHDLKLAFINEEGERLIGISANELKGRTNDQLTIFDPHTSNKLNQKIREVFNTGNPIDFFNQVEFKGKKYHKYVKLVPEYEEGTHNISTVLTLTRDITELRQYEERLSLKHDELKNINHYLNNFVYTVAHDLRSPLTNLRLIADLVKTSENTEDNLLYTENINNSVNRVENILNGIIEIINSQFSVETVVKKLSFKEILEKVKLELVLKLKKSDARVRYDFQVDHIKYPETYLSSIFRNLISNAVKYRKPEVSPLIEITTKRSGEFIVLEFRDNGTGIDLERNKKNLFRPFKRFIEDQEGKGIGLHLVQSMVRKNGGEIQLESELDKGTTFRLFLKEYADDI